jgi:hypothetical protein
MELARTVLTVGRKIVVQLHALAAPVMFCVRIGAARRSSTTGLDGASGVGGRRGSAIALRPCFPSRFKCRSAPRAKSDSDNSHSQALISTQTLVRSRRASHYIQRRRGLEQAQENIKRVTRVHAKQHKITVVAGTLL